MAEAKRLPTTLVDLLSVSLVLRQTAPYIQVKSLLALACTSKELRNVIYCRPEAWRHLDLRNVGYAVIDSSPIDRGGFAWRAERMDESLTEDDFYSGPLRGIFAKLQRRSVLQFVQTLILDGLTVPADLVGEILTEDRFNVKILSLREARQLNQTKLQQILRYIVRPTRPEGTPKLRALYVFGPKDSPSAASSAVETSNRTSSLGVMGSQGAQIGARSWNQQSSRLSARLLDEETRWYTSSGRAIRLPAHDWADTIFACRGVICFDAVLCRGPRHDITKVDSREFLQPAIATVALGPKACESCGTCPEGTAAYKASPDSALPLLGPVPSHSSTLKAALQPERGADGNMPRLTLRCEACLRSRWCEQCNRFWCEDCYQEPTSRIHLRTGMQQLELQDDLRRNGWSAVTQGPGDNSVKVFSNLCVSQCLVGEMMTGAGSNGMWG